MGMSAATFDTLDGETEGQTAGFDGAQVRAMINKTAAVSAGGASELADIKGIYNVIINFLRNSIAIGGKYGYHSNVSSNQAEMPVLYGHWAGTKLWKGRFLSFFYFMVTKRDDNRKSSKLQSI